MEDIPFVKGWIPFKSGLSEKVSSRKTEPEKVDVPKNWKDSSLKQGDNPHGRLFALSEFKVLYPKALDTYINEVFPIFKRALQEYYIKAELNRLDGEIIIKSTPKTFDPVAILKAHSFGKLLSRYVPIEEAMTVLNEDMSEDIIPIDHCKKDTFIRRRSRIDNDEIKELIKEILNCKIYPYGKSVAAIGMHDNLKKVRKIVMDCFVNNIHPIYHLKRFQVMNKLKEIPEMADKDWSSILPPIPKSKNTKRKKPSKIREKKDYTPFPPEPVESKIDKELASGVFHLKYEKTNRNFYKPIAKKRKNQSGNSE